MEMHCSLPQQAKIGLMLRRHLGDRLLLPEDIQQGRIASVSPDGLRNKVLVKGSNKTKEQRDRGKLRRSVESKGGGGTLL